jgi:Zn-dependent M28 family amino/carboxypeptidase
MLGSEAYVRAHRAEMDHVDAAMVFDDGVGRTRGFFLGGRRDTEAALRAAEQPIASWGVDDNPPDAIWGSDHDDFLLEGVPTFVANQDEANYQENYHAASDTLDKVDLRDLEFNTAVAATVAFGLADLPQRAGPRLTRAELDTLMQQTGLGDQMRQLGVWDAWANGSRGRAR